jgi:hypothetical protein
MAEQREAVQFFVAVRLSVLRAGSQVQIHYWLFCHVMTSISVAVLSLAHKLSSQSAFLDLLCGWRRRW